MTVTPPPSRSAGRAATAVERASTALGRLRHGRLLHPAGRSFVGETVIWGTPGPPTGVALLDDPAGTGPPSGSPRGRRRPAVGRTFWASRCACTATPAGRSTCWSAPAARPRCCGTCRCPDAASPARQHDHVLPRGSAPPLAGRAGRPRLGRPRSQPGHGGRRDPGGHAAPGARGRVGGGAVAAGRAGQPRCPAQRPRRTPRSRSTRRATCHPNCGWQVRWPGCATRPTGGRAGPAGRPLSPAVRPRPRSDPRYDVPAPCPGGVLVRLADVRLGEDGLRLRLRVVAAHRRLLGQEVVRAGLHPLLIALLVCHGTPVTPTVAPGTRCSPRILGRRAGGPPVRSGTLAGVTRSYRWFRQPARTPVTSP